MRAAGCFSEDDGFHPIVSLNTAVVEEVVRRLVLIRLNRARRLSYEFLDNFLSCRHSAHYVLLVIALNTIRIAIAGITTSPNAPRMSQMARPLTDADESFL